MLRDDFIKYSLFLNIDVVVVDNCKLAEIAIKRPGEPCFFFFGEPCYVCSGLWVCSLRASNFSYTELKSVIG